MEIRLVSSMTTEDEDRLAPALLKAFAAFLDSWALPYTVRIETSGTRVFQHTRPAAEVLPGNHVEFSDVDSFQPRPATRQGP